MNQDFLLPILLVGLLAMMFFSSRKRKKQAADLESKLQVGAKVMLTSGIFGTITSIEEDRVTIETAPKTKITVIKGAVRVVDAPAEIIAESSAE
jgi:preprotein translocase subunit YajC